MPFFVFDINKEVPKNGHKYFFDANIWLAVLETVYRRAEYRPYIKFFNSIIDNTHVRDATIAVPCLLLGELLNRLIIDIYFNEYKKLNPGFAGKVKDYRKTAEYNSDLQAATASIRAYHQKIEFVSDNLDQYSCKDLIKNIPVQLDINDYLYSKIALEQGIVIVTHDQDFSVEDIHIITSHKSLLSLNNPIL